MDRKIGTVEGTVVLLIISSVVVVLIWIFGDFSSTSNQESGLVRSVMPRLENNQIK